MKVKVISFPYIFQVLYVLCFTRSRYQVSVYRTNGPLVAYAKTKTQISFVVTAKLISVFVFATKIVQSLYFLNPKFQASSHLLWLYSPVCVGPGRKPRRLFFSQRGSNSFYFQWICFLAISPCQIRGLNEPRHEKTGLRGFRPGPTQTGLYSHRSWLET